MRQGVVSLGRRLTTSGWLLALVPSLIFLFHTSMFRHWIVDDAGISFVYARNLAQGNGLVAQPGVPPVEGYSNPSWVLLLAPFFSLGIFHPTITPKIISALLVIASYVILCRTLRLSGIRQSLIAAVLVLISMNTSLVAWSTSGMENALYAFFLMLLFFVTVRGIVLEETRSRNAIGAGLLAGAVALTRPEGIIFCGLYPLVVLADRLGRPRSGFKARLTNLLNYGLVLLLVFGGFMFFRLTYFGDLFPNPYHAKGGPSFQDFVSLVTLQPAIVAKVQALMTGVAGSLGGIVLAGLIIMTIHLVSTGRFRPEHLALSVFVVWGACAYILLPYDWMGEFRFATPFLVFFYAHAVVITHAFIASFKVAAWRRKAVVAVMAVAFVGGSVFMFVQRSASFAKKPTVSFATVAESYGHRFNRIADRLGVEGGSMLLPDIGGTLYYSKLRIYDMGGLCDKTIAKTLRGDQRAFYDYVFEVMKPTFIHTHGFWTYRTRLEYDERFRRDYVAMHEFPDSWVKKNYGLSLHSGDYVRREVIGNDAEALSQIQSEFF